MGEHYKDHEDLEGQEEELASLIQAKGKKANESGWCSFVSSTTMSYIFLAVLMATVLATVGSPGAKDGADIAFESDGERMSYHGHQQQHLAKPIPLAKEELEGNDKVLTGKAEPFAHEVATKKPTQSPTANPTAPPKAVAVPANHKTDTAIAKKQKENFRKGDALMINLHMTHHGGTTFCGKMKKYLKAPSFACNHPRPPQVVADDYPDYKPWSHEDTGKNIGLVKKHFDLLGWEFSQPPGAKLHDVDWENPNLVSVIIMREPISRLLAGDGMVAKKYPGIQGSAAKESQWWDFANEQKHTNNFALHILAGPDCCQGNSTDPIHLDKAKSILDQFTYVVDIACLDAGMQAIADDLGIEGTFMEENAAKAKKHHHAPISERIPFPEVYDYLLERNKLDIELYEYSKSIGVVDCAALKPSQAPTSTARATTPSPKKASTRSPTAPPTKAPTTTSPSEPPTPAPTAPPKKTAIRSPTSPPKAVAVPTNHKAIVKQQVQHFRKGKGLLLNLHITHHGGTTFCGKMGEHLKRPDFACLIGGKDPFDDLDAPKKYPWSHDDTGRYVGQVKKHFDLLSWEFSQPPGPYEQLADTDFENPNLVSVIIMREPISRLLAGDGYIKKKFPGINIVSSKPQQQQATAASLEEWYSFANEPKHTNNFALRVLAGNSCCQGNSTDPIHLENAKALLDRFTYVLDIACLTEGMQALSDELGLNVLIEEQAARAKRHQHPPISERIPYPEVYDYLQERNKLDIELYEYSKSISLVNCAALESPTDASPPDTLPVTPPTGSPNAPPKEITSPPKDIPKQVEMSAVAMRQVQRYRKGKALMLNLHMTHHGGTTFCGKMKSYLRAPSFACNHPRAPQVVGDDYPDYKPWSHDDTGKNIIAAKKYFDLVAWEFSQAPGKLLPETNWESPDLVSVVIMREPISRLLAGDGIMWRKYPGLPIGSRPNNSTLEEWYGFANEHHHTNNFALQILAGTDCCQGNTTDQVHLENAKALLSRFTYVLDIACLDVGMQAIADDLGIEADLIELKSGTHHSHPPVSERIGNPEVYEYLKERNKLDIELYEWAKTISRVDCSALH